MQKKLVARTAAIATMCALLMAPFAAETASAAPAQPAGLLGDQLLRGDVMTPGSYILSDAHDHTLEMQTDGNLVEYQIFGGNKYACWATNTNGQYDDYAVYQGDGNFVVYGSDGHAHWASNTVGDRGTTVNIATGVQTDGELYVGYTLISGTEHC